MAAQWERASIIGRLVEIPVSIFVQIMNDVLCTYLVYKVNIQGTQAMAKYMDFKGQGFSNLGHANYYSGLEKILAPLVLVHLREREELSVKLVETITNEVFICFTNLLVPSGQSTHSICFLHHFVTDELAQIEWRMDFFNKLFAKVLPKLQIEFKGINLKNEFFLYDWMITMFTKVQGLEGIELVLRIWDIYLLHGEPILYCFALVILKLKHRSLNNAPMNYWLDYFTDMKNLDFPQQSHILEIAKNDELDEFESENINNPDSKLLIPIV